MLVVIAVMGLAMALVVNYRQPHSQWLQTQTASRQLAQALRAARGQAISEGHPVAPALPRLPAGITEAVQAPKGGILFAPDGSASGGQIVLASPGGKITVSVDWLTGRVSTRANEAN